MQGPITVFDDGAYAGDALIDGGNSNYQDDIARIDTSRAKELLDEVRAGLRAAE